MYKHWKPHAGELGDAAADHLDKAASQEVKGKVEAATGSDEDSALIEQMQKELATEKAGMKTGPAEGGKLE